MPLNSVIKTLCQSYFPYTKFLNIHITGQGPAYEATNVKWSRPDIPNIDPATDKLVFQQIDLDSYTDTDGTPSGLDKSQPHVRGHNTVIRLYGVTDEGYSVMAHLHGYIPYFYASVPSEQFTAADCERFKVKIIFSFDFLKINHFLNLH